MMVTGKKIIKKKLFSVNSLLWHIPLFILAVLFSIPFLWMIVTSLKVPGTEFQFPPSFIPNPPMFSNYVKALTIVPFYRYFINSIIVTGLTLVLQISTCALAGYSFGRLEFPGQNFIFMLFLVAMMIPPQVLLVPRYIIMKQLGWIDTYPGIIAPGVFWPLAAFIFRQFFRSLPSSYEDSGRIEGANHFQIFLKIMLPLCKPAVSTSFIIGFIQSWNALTWPLIIINTEEYFTVPLGLMGYIMSHGVGQWSYLMAATLVSLVPVILVFAVLQKYFVDAMIHSGIKG